MTLENAVKAPKTARFRAKYQLFSLDELRALWAPGNGLSVLDLRVWCADASTFNREERSARWAKTVLARDYSKGQILKARTKLKRLQQPTTLDNKFIHSIPQILLRRLLREGNKTTILVALFATQFVNVKNQGAFHLRQASVGTALGVRREAVSRAVRHLVERGILIRLKQTRDDIKNNSKFYAFRWTDAAERLQKYTPEKFTPEAREKRGVRLRMGTRQGGLQALAPVLSIPVPVLPAPSLVPPQILRQCA